MTNLEMAQNIYREMLETDLKSIGNIQLNKTIRDVLNVFDKIASLEELAKYNNLTLSKLTKEIISQSCKNGSQVILLALKINQDEKAIKALLVKQFNLLKDYCKQYIDIVGALV